MNLGTPGAYLEKISEETKDIDVTVVFNNAGFMVTGFFDKTCAARCFSCLTPLSELAHAHRPLGKSMANVECNAVSAVQITHVFVTRMLAKKQRGCVVFTSSAAACQPCPFSSMYGATKAFISSFGASLAIEVKTRGIDVTVVHPSPVASRFYDKAHALDSIAFFKKCVWRAFSGLCISLTAPAAGSTWSRMLCLTSSSPPLAVACGVTLAALRLRSG